MRKRFVLFVGVLCAVCFILAACGAGQPADDSDEVAQIVSLTMTAISSEVSTPAVDAAGGLKPLADNCEDLKTSLGAAMGTTVTVETVPVETSLSGETGTACQMTAVSGGARFGNVLEVSSSLRGLLETRDWTGYLQLPCLGHGGAGPVADQLCYTYENQVCEIMIAYEPLEMSLCEGIEGPIDACLDALTPEQKQYKVIQTCAEGSAQVQKGAITGFAQMLDPYTPGMTIYALDPVTGKWASALTAETEGPAPFTLEVVPGSYQIFSSLGTGYAAADGWSLAAISVESGQTVSGVNVSPPGASQCGPMFGVPASPDGLHPPLIGATADCIVSLDLPKAEPARIEFAAGTFQTQLHGTLGPQGLEPYVLYAMQDQEMILNLYPTGPAYLVVSGLDGTVLVSKTAETTSLIVRLPLTQDYYIDINSQSGETIAYTLAVSIPPGAAANNGRVHPKVEPFSSGLMQSLAAHSAPVMLPPEFPAEAGTPGIVPYLFTARAGEYEASLDYGLDCRGTGACHYGVITGMQTDSAVPVGTTTFPFEAGRARLTPLANGITGYFVDYTCGANCNDAVVWWVYDGYQYSIGLKAGPRTLVIALANAAITNSMP
ncbi:MAG: hypothetical protein JXA13_05580 [Anaerolineales bacterium]|nr:hypothetical protein [Anaerolineales bacterium]